MQTAEMSALCLLRSQSHLLNLTKHRLLSPPINSIISLNRSPQNPNFSRHLLPISNRRFIHSINHRSSSESPLTVSNDQTPSNSPISERNFYQNPSKWSVFNSTSNTSNSVEQSHPEASDSDEESPPKASDSEEESPSKASDSEEESPEKVVNSVSYHPNTKAVMSFVGRGKKGKGNVQWVCSHCGHSQIQWWGTCRACHKAGTMVQVSTEEAAGGKVSGFEVSENAMRSWLPKQKAGRFAPVRLADVNRGVDQSDWRIHLYGILGAEVAQVLGGGVVPGSLVLIGGDPGVGKSTLLLQIAGLIADSVDTRDGGPVIYISGEESVEQIGNRADRLSITAEDLFLYSSTNIEDILEKVQPLCPRALIIDSIQTVYLRGVTGSPGGISQVKECTAALLRFSKETSIPVLLIGHVNKSGDIAGPQILEHIVDVVLYMEGEKNSSHRLLRSVKNRFGSTDELGVFEMSESGLQTVSNPSEMFLSEVHSESEHLPGIAVAVIMDGSRTFLIEVQALYVADSIGKHYNGVQASRADMIISVLKKQAGLRMQDYSVFLNVVSGLSLTETSGDLAVAAAICSSYLEQPIPNDVAFIGEIGLGGELRMVPRIEKRVANLAKLGYKMCIVPKLAKKALAALNFEGLRIVGCNNLKEVIAEVFRK